MGKAPMRIDRVVRDKKRYIDLLLLADEQENMIDRYLMRSQMYVLLWKDVYKRQVLFIADQRGALPF